MMSNHIDKDVKSPTIRTMQVRVDMLRELELPNNGADWAALVAPYQDWKFLRGDHVDVVLVKPGVNEKNPQPGDYIVLDSLTALAWRKANDVWDFQD